MVLKIITFNILAHKYTYFNRGHTTEKESLDEMKLRYVKVLQVLKKLKADIYCLQEVDNIAKLFLIKKFKESGYNHYFVDKSKHEGLLLLWKDKYDLLNKYKRDITHLFKTRNRSFPNKTQVAQYITLQIGDDTLQVVNTKLWGNPKRHNTRSQELETLIENIDFNNKVIICGDFNETNYKMIEKVLGSKLKLYDKYFKKKEFATSFHPWNTDLRTRKMYEEPFSERYKSVDYFIYSTNIKVTKFKVLPTKKGIYCVDEPYKDSKTKYNSSKWPSDHALLCFKVKI